MEKWVCKKCGRETTEKPHKNQICNHNGCTGRFAHYRACKKCGEWFADSGYNRTLCNQCSDRAGHERKGKVRVICGNCGKEFGRYASNVKGKTNFCSRACMEESRKGEVRSQKCEYCGKPFTVYASAVEKTNAAGRFCSKVCYHKSMTIDEERVYTGFEVAKKKYFRGAQFCAVCGTTKRINIHHIIPNRLTHDQSRENLIPLCAAHHPMIEAATRDFISAMDGDVEKAGELLRLALRDRQFQTLAMIKSIK